MTEDEYIKATRVTDLPDAKYGDVAEDLGEIPRLLHEVIDLIRDAMDDRSFAGFCNGNAIKYLCRDGKKGDPAGDVSKASWYQQMAAHVLLGGLDPRASRPGWDQERDGYKRPQPVDGFKPSPFAHTQKRK